MINNIYYNIDLYNYIYDKIIHYNKKIANCINLLKVIEENYDNYNCKTKIIKYINKLFQNNYKIKDTNSIKIIYEEKEIYYYHRGEGKNETRINNIKINIKECFGYINKSKYEINERKIWKIKDIDKNKKCKKKKDHIKYDVSVDFTKYIERMETIKEDLYNTKDGRNAYFCFINNKITEEELISDIDFEIEIKMDKTEQI